MTRPAEVGRAVRGISIGCVTRARRLRVQPLLHDSGEQSDLLSDARSPSQLTPDSARTAWSMSQTNHSRSSAQRSSSLSTASSLATASSSSIAAGSSGARNTGSSSRRSSWPSAASVCLLPPPLRRPLDRVSLNRTERTCTQRVSSPSPTSSSPSTQPRPRRHPRSSRSGSRGTPSPWA